MAIFTVFTKFLEAGVCTYDVILEFEAKMICLAKKHGHYFT